MKLLSGELTMRDDPHTNKTILKKIAVTAVAFTVTGLFVALCSEVFYGSTREIRGLREMRGYDIVSFGEFMSGWLAALVWRAKS